MIRVSEMKSLQLIHFILKAILKLLFFISNIFFLTNMAWDKTFLFTRNSTTDYISMFLLPKASDSPNFQSLCTINVWVGPKRILP